MRVSAGILNRVKIRAMTLDCAASYLPPSFLHGLKPGNILKPVCKFFAIPIITSLSPHTGGVVEVEGFHCHAGSEMSVAEVIRTPSSLSSGAPVTLFNEIGHVRVFSFAPVHELSVVFVLIGYLASQFS